MPYREKTAWLALFAMALTFGPYFILVATAPPAVEPLPNFRQLGVYASVALSQMVLLGLGHLILRRASPQEARMPADERDRAIDSRALSAAYYVLIFGMILVGVIMPFQSAGWTIVNAALFAIVFGEVVRYSVVVINYRRQA